jgi:uncharacterized protein YqeY
MSIRDDVQNEMKAAMKAKDTLRLECLRMVKGALLLKEKEAGKEVSDEDAVQVLRTEVRKRRQSIELFQEHGKNNEAAAAEAEIAIIEEFLPKQLSEDEVEAKVRAYLAEHPDINHAGKLTGAMKKELGDTVDGKLLNDVCRRVLG